MDPTRGHKTVHRPGAIRAKEVHVHGAKFLPRERAAASALQEVTDKGEHRGTWVPQVGGGERIARAGICEEGTEGDTQFELLLPVDHFGEAIWCREGRACGLDVSRMIESPCVVERS